jgi:hypothetical protein
MKLKEPKMKRLGVKGMKNMEYLGHFAQDKYMHKGHNLSGQYPMKRNPAAFDASVGTGSYQEPAEDSYTGSQSEGGPNITAAASGPTQKIRVRAPGYEASGESDAQYVDVERPLTGEEQTIKRDADLYNARASTGYSDVKENYSGEFRNKGIRTTEAYNALNSSQNQSFVSDLYANRYKKNYRR